MFVMVLNDGETFSHLEGCRIIEVPDDYTVDDIEETLAGPDAKTIEYF